VDLFDLSGCNLPDFLRDRRIAFAADRRQDMPRFGRANAVSGGMRVV
jgi:hypothetical protein